MSSSVSTSRDDPTAPPGSDTVNTFRYQLFVVPVEDVVAVFRRDDPNE